MTNLNFTFPRLKILIIFNINNAFKEYKTNIFVLNERYGFVVTHVYYIRGHVTGKLLTFLVT
jgi:hypothetical protein